MSAERAENSRKRAACHPKAAEARSRHSSVGITPPPNTGRMMARHACWSAEAIERLRGPSARCASLGMIALPANPKLFADSVLELPDAQCCEQKTFRAGEGADGGQFFDGTSRHGAFARTAPARLGLAGAARSLADGKVASVVHAVSKSSFQAIPTPPLSPLCASLISTSLAGHG